MSEWYCFAIFHNQKTLKQNSNNVNIIADDNIIFFHIHGRMKILQIQHISQIKHESNNAYLHLLIMDAKF